MSDMLQLVVEIHNTQAMILLVGRTLEVTSGRQAEACRTLKPRLGLDSDRCFEARLPVASAALHIQNGSLWDKAGFDERQIANDEHNCTR